MTIPIRVLFVEDSEDDAVLLLRELRRGGYGPVFERVDTHEAMVSALDRQAWDIIIADYVMPRFSGLAALKLVKERGLETPFIIVSGKIGEEVAVEAMRAGAHDYIIKNNLVRLVPAIDRELREAEVRRERKRAEQKLRQSERKYRQLVELAREGIWVIDPGGRTTFVNPRMAEMLGYAVKEMTGRPVFSFVEECAVEAMRAHVERNKRGFTDHFDFIFIRKDGARVYTSLETSPVTDDDGNITGAMALVADITERKRMEESLRVSEANLRRITDNMMDMITQTDAGFIYRYVSPSHKSFLGYEPEDMLGKSVLDFVHKSDLKRTAAILETFIKTKSQVKLELRFRHAGGHYLWIESTGNLLLDDGGRVTGAIFEKHDITERKMAEIKVKTYEMKLRSLAAKLSLAEERERRRIASDIHDHIGQSLAVAKMELGALRKSLSSTTLIKVVEEIKDLVEKTIQYTRSLTFEISPPILYELGFEAAVEWLGEQIIEKRGIRFHFEDDGQLKPLDDEIRVILFTAVRELLMNIVKHAKARMALVSVQKHGQNLHVRVEDDGSGFDASKKGYNFSKNGGFGLFSVRERLKHMGGNMEIESMPGSGTIITMEAPLKRQKVCGGGYN